MDDEPPRDLVGASMVTVEYCTKNRAINGKVDSMIDVIRDVNFNVDEIVVCGFGKLVNG